MKYLIILILMVITSCEPQPNVKTTFLLTNDSIHKIDIILFNITGNDTMQLKNQLDEISIVAHQKSSIHPPPFVADSVKVIYDDTISITHFRIQGQDIMKNIFLDDSWIEDQKSESEYTFAYIFTEEDYLEAKEQ